MSDLEGGKPLEVDTYLVKDAGIDEEDTPLDQ